MEPALINKTYLCIYPNIRYYLKYFGGFRFAQIDAKKEESAKLSEKPLEINEWDKNPEEMNNGSDPNSTTGMRKR